MKIDPYYQRRRCSPTTLDSGNVDIRGGSQDLCKFSLDFMPAPTHYTGIMHDVVVFKFKCLAYDSWLPIGLPRVLMRD